MNKENIKIGITHGDINSISYEVILNAFSDNRMYENVIPIIYGSAKVAAYHKKALNIANVNLNQVRNADEANTKKIHIINCIDDNARVELGKSTSIAGEAAVMALEQAVADLKTKKIDAVVTGPINKENIQSDKFNFKGHTEYFQDHFKSEDVLMFMVSDVCRIGVVTGHIPLNLVSTKITENLIFSKLKIMNLSLLKDFGIRKPRIAVLGLNPHAGDNGVIGTEESKTILPAINKAREKGILAFGPFPADGFFASGNFKKFDAVLAMYHDQGLIPFKLMNGYNGVNYTAGLPIVRTSPAHGTAFELVGKGEASCDSFRSAFYLAIDIVKNRRVYTEISANPLKPQELPEAGSTTLSFEESL